MPGFVATVASPVLCAHGGKATPAPLPVRVFLTGLVPAVTISSPWLIAGCSLTPSGSPFCATGQFTAGSTRVFASIGAGPVPLVLTPSPSTCVATGQPMVQLPAGQSRVIAS